MFKRTLILVFLGLMFLCSQLIADDNPLGWEISKTVLDNGLKVVILEDHSTPSLAFHVWFHVGSKNERPGITGISHMVEHMMFQGSTNVEPGEHNDIIMAKGGIPNAFTHFDMTAYHESMGSDDLETAIWLEAERLQNLTISPEKLASEKEVVAEERGTRIDNAPYGPVFELLLSTVYNAHPYSWQIIGWMSDIKAYTAEKLRNHFETYYTVNNATVVIVGDVDTDEALELVEKYFGDIEPGPENLYRPTTVEPPQMGERRAKVHRMAQVPGFFVGYKVVESGHPDMYPLKVLGKILFDGESSRLYKRLVDEEQLCLFAGGDMFEFEDPSLFYMIAIMQGPEKLTEDAETIIYEELDKLKTEPVPEKVLQKALNQIEADEWSGIESNDGKAYAIGFMETIRDDYTQIFTELDKYLAVTADDIMRVANKYFDEKNRTVITLVPDMAAPSASLGY